MSGPAPAFGASFVEQLLALPTAAEQLAHIQQAGLADAEGLSGLLEEAAALVRTNPGQAHRLTIIYAEAADQAGVSELIPRAAYLKAQTHALAGEFEKAQALINVARAGYLALGQETAALRTTAGLMNVLGESGRYQEALDAGQGVLDKASLDEKPEMAGLLAVIQKNMGLCYNYLGRYEEALTAYNASENLYHLLGMTAEAGDISNNRGILLWEIGRGTEALAALEQALATRTETNQTMLMAQTLSNIGSVHLLLGNYTASLESFERARRLFETLDPLLDKHVLLLDTANAYLTLNLYEEAMAAYEEAAQLLGEAGVIYQEVRAYWGLGATLLAKGQTAEAERVLANAVASLEMSLEETTPLLAALLLEQAAAQATARKVSLAERTAHQALALVQDKAWPIPTIYAHLQLADLAQDEPVRSEPHLTAAQELVNTLGLPHLRYRLQQRFGRLRRRQGRREEARLFLEEAAAGIERLRGTLAQEMLRTSFLHDKSAVYDELMQLYLSRDDQANHRAAFTVAERAKSRTLLDLITGFVNTGGQDSAGELQADLNAIYNELLNPGSSVMVEGRQKALQARAVELERAIMQRQLRQTDGGEAADQWARPLSAEAVQRQLPPGTTLLVYHILDGEILAFVVTGSDLRLFRSLAEESYVMTLLRRLESMLDRLRAGVFTAEQVDLLELSARRVLGMLYQSLVAPLASFLAESAAPNGDGLPPKLTVVAHGCLHQLPFHALHDGVGYLIEKYEISCAPSATIYCQCQSRPQPGLENALVIGVPDPAIPAVTAEIEAVAARLPGARLLHDTTATRENIMAAVNECGLLHLACHGIFRADNPMFSALKLHDGWLTAGEAMKLRLSNALVTLSACESGRSRVVGGDELLGLLRGFLGAGATTIVVSLWLAQDVVTAGLMVDWYNYMCETGAAPARALREAQLTVKKEYSHPFYWAPFIAVGRR